jgi:exocyst complex component 2
VHSFIYEALLSLVQVHAQVRAVAKPLVQRTISALLDDLAGVILEAFGEIPRFGMGGMLQVRRRPDPAAERLLTPFAQATLEIEFLHQTLSQYVTPKSEATLKQIYETISRKYVRGSGAAGTAEAEALQRELESVKRTLVSSRKATALEFLCFRRPREERDSRARDARSRDGSAPSSAGAAPSSSEIRTSSERRR